MTIINIIAIILSPIIALFISHKVQISYEKRKEKMEILKILMARRVLSNSIEYVNALNIIDIIFVDSPNSPKVKAAYKSLYEAYHQPNYDVSKSQMKLTKLIEAIVADVGYNEKITWDDIQQPYYPVWLDDQLKTDSTIQKYNLAIASSALCNYQQHENNKG